MVKKVKKSFELNITLYKILLTVYELNSMNKYPSLKGVHNVLKGREDRETNQYVFLSTYGTLTSLQSRKFASYVSLLEKKAYLAYKYDKKTDKLYIYISQAGISLMDDFSKHHKVNLKKHIKNPNLEIVEIN